MADKLRKTQPLKITHSDGEQPTAQKLTAIAEQSRNGSHILEKAIGDLWNDSGDKFYSSQSLQIANIARTLGRNVELNPTYYPIKNNFEYTQQLGLLYNGKTEGYLRFPMATGGTLDFSLISWSSRVTNERDVDASGEFWLDEDTGKWRSFDPVSFSEKITYEVSKDTWNTRTATDADEINPSVIPDPRQATFTSCRVSLISGKYHIHIPPRRPLVGINSIPDNYPSSTETVLNEASTTATPYSMWQDGVTALTGANFGHYRYPLPEDLFNGIILAGGATPADQVPDGTMYLWDQVNETIIDGVIFKFSTTESLFEALEIDVSGSSYDFAAAVTADELEASYSGTNISLITCGAQASRHIANLNRLVMDHSHDGKNQDQSISHNNLIDSNPPTSDYALHTTRYPTYLPAWVPSNWEFDNHNYLLSRAGAQVSGRERDIYNNAMLGDFLIGNADPATTGVRDYLNAALPDGSFKIFFGDITGPSIYASDTNTIESNVTFQATGNATNKVGLRGIANTSGEGVYGTSTSGYGVQGISTSGFGVRGQSTSENGIYGITNGTSKAGVYGAGNTGTNCFGVLGIGGGTAAGVHGQAFGTDQAAGVFGTSAATNGDGVYGLGTGTGTGVGGKGISGYGVSAESTTGIALYANGIANYGAVIEGDSTTGPARSAFRIVPQDGAPVTLAQGDIWIDDVSGLVNSRINSTQNQIIVGNVHRITSSDSKTASSDHTSYSFAFPAGSLKIGSVIRAEGFWRVISSSSGTARANILRNNESNDIGTLASVSASDLIKVVLEITVRTIHATTGTVAYNATAFYPSSTIRQSGTVDTSGDTSGSYTLMPRIDIGGTATIELQSFTVDIS